MADITLTLMPVIALWYEVCASCLHGSEAVRRFRPEELNWSGPVSIRAAVAEWMLRALGSFECACGAAARSWPRWEERDGCHCVLDSEALTWTHRKNLYDLSCGARPIGAAPCFCTYHFVIVIGVWAEAELQPV